MTRHRKLHTTFSPLSYFQQVRALVFRVSRRRSGDTAHTRRQHTAAATSGRPAHAGRRPFLASASGRTRPQYLQATMPMASGISTLSSTSLLFAAASSVCRFADDDAPVAARAMISAHRSRASRSPFASFRHWALLGPALAFGCAFKEADTDIGARRRLPLSLLVGIAFLFSRSTALARCVWRRH